MSSHLSLRSNISIKCLREQLCTAEACRSRTGPAFRDESWRIFIVDEANARNNAKNKGYSFEITISSAGGIDTESKARKVAEQFCRIWERLPYSWPAGTQRRPYVEHVARALPDYKVQLTNVQSYPRTGGGTALRVTYQLISPTDGTRKERRCWITPSSLDTKITIPDVTQNVDDAQRSIFLPVRSPKT